MIKVTTKMRTADGLFYQRQLTEHINVVLVGSCFCVLSYCIILLTLLFVLGLLLLFGNPFDSAFPILWLCLHLLCVHRSGIGSSGIFHWGYSLHTVQNGRFWRLLWGYNTSESYAKSAIHQKVMQSHSEIGKTLPCGAECYPKIWPPPKKTHTTTTTTTHNKNKTKTDKVKAIIRDTKIGNYPLILV